MIYFADESWTPNQKNPFSPDGSYGANWSAFCYDKRLTEETNNVSDANVYTILMPPSLDPNFDRIRDFIQYETYYERHSIVRAGKEELYAVQEALMMLHPQKGVKLRSYDPTVLVYSTTEEEWAKIKESGKLTPSGKQAFPLEPDDYRQYLLLDKPQTVSEPGVRIYLDGKALFENGLIMRDGFHTAKVFYSLLLRPYLLGVVTKDDLPPQEWTAQSFTKAANDYAKENF